MTKAAVAPVLTQADISQMAMNKTLHDLAMCESGDKKVINEFDGGSPSKFWFQWKDSSWARYNALFGTYLDIEVREDQYEMTRRVIERGDTNNWYTCWRNIQNM